MNRLVIIGNGFDLAHGLPTGYCDFIDWYWRKTIEKIELFPDGSYKRLMYKDKIIEICFKFQMKSPEDMDSIKEEFSELKTYSDLKSFVFKYKATDRDERSLSFDKEYNCNNCFLRYSNFFFKIINNKQSIQKWVDIENEYYDILKDCLKDARYRRHKTDVETLNKELEQVKNLFEQYLTEEVYDRYDFNKPSPEIDELIGEFNVWKRFTRKTDFIEEFPEGEKGVEDYCKILKQYNTSGGTNITKYLESENHQVKNYFLSFNYTPTLTSYLSKMKNDDMNYFGENTLIQIHGCLNDDKNKINFGFGDEMDDDYKTIENKNDNEYLKYIKSFQYAQNDNYKRLLDFIDSEKFQVYLIGHSCGLSDRILLNTVFEHENCRSIKIYYYDKGNGEDDYTTIVQNISRHFNDKKLMRSKIVNKSLCKPLHQKVRFEKKK